MTEQEQMDALAGEGSILRENIRDLKERESRLLGTLRDTMQEMERTRFRLNQVNDEIARRANATR